MHISSVKPCILDVLFYITIQYNITYTYTSRNLHQMYLFVRPGSGGKGTSILHSYLDRCLASTLVEGKKHHETNMSPIHMAKNREMS